MRGHLKPATIVATLLAVFLLCACSSEEQVPAAEPSAAAKSLEDSSTGGRPLAEEAGSEAVAVPSVTSVTISPGDFSAGTDLTAVVECSDQTLPVQFVFAWFINGQRYWFADQETLPGDAFSRGDTVSVAVTPRLNLVDGEVVASKELLVPNALPIIESDPKDAFMDAGGYAAGGYTYQVIASDADGDPLTFFLQQSPQGMVVDAGTGLVSWDLSQASEGEVSFIVGVRDDHEGETLQTVRLKLGTVTQGGAQ